MSGDSKNNDDPDFLDDDFVIDDIANKGDDLDQLFVDPAAAANAAKAANAAAAATNTGDADDTLFTDHTQGLHPSERFSGGGAFAENGPSAWSGEELELDTVGISDAESEVAAETTAPPEAEVVEPTLAVAEETFAKELDSLLHSEEEFALDSEKELELVDGPSADGISEVEQSGPFVLDDGEGTWREDAEAVPIDSEQPEADQVADDLVEAAANDGSVLEPALVTDELPIEPGWEPLPETSVDELAEVDDVARTDGGEEVEAGEGELVGAGIGVTDLAAVEGHNLYAAEPSLVRGGARPGSRRFGRIAATLAASLALVGGAAVAVLRPEWIGLSLEPQGVQQVQIERPQVQVVVALPPAVAVSAPQLVATPTKPPTPTSDPQPETTPSPNPVVVQVTTSTPDSADPTAVTEPPKPTPVVVEVPPTTTPVLPEAPATTPVATAPEPVAPSVLPNAPNGSWPIANTPGSKTSSLAPTNKQQPLVRVSDNLLVGETEQQKPIDVRAVEGVLPGTRAFAQLHNGNYFIGSVKVASADRITLRVDDGEVTLASAEILRLTQLGTADYDALQKATSGFVRLTNNNRLVGAILSEIADDHIVLEFRSNRVMLPKSAIGQVVQGVDESGIRLDVTSEEDRWVQTLAERQLGSGTGAAVLAPVPQSSAKPPVSAKAPSPAPSNGRQQ